MSKIVFIGAGSTAFAKNVLGDCLITPALSDAHIALHDIDQKKLNITETMLNNLKNNLNKSKVKITSHIDRREALKDADYVINAINVGGLDSQIIDAKIPYEKYGLHQTIADTLGIGGIFKGLRTIPVMLEIAKDMEELCPDALFINYTNPMVMITGAMLKATSIKTVGLCHSVQICVYSLLKGLGMLNYDKFPHPHTEFESVKEIMQKEKIKWKIAGINHMAWLLEITKDGKDLYPEIKRKANKRSTPHRDMVRYEMMKQFGYYITESSHHLAEYLPYFLNNNYPELIKKFNLQEWIENYINEDSDERYQKRMNNFIDNPDMNHTQHTREYASYIIEAMETDNPCRIYGNVSNTDLITNLPQEAIVEVPCMVDQNGINPCHIGELPQQLAALNRSNINVQLLTIKAALTRKKDYIYQAAMLDPHTAAELSIDDIKALCDDMIQAHKDILPEYK